MTSNQIGGGGVGLGLRWSFLEDVLASDADMVIEVVGGNSIAAIITNASAARLALDEGANATALFKASSVILAVSP